MNFYKTLFSLVLILSMSTICHGVAKKGNGNRSRKLQSKVVRDKKRHERIHGKKHTAQGADMSALYLFTESPTHGRRVPRAQQ